MSFQKYLKKLDDLIERDTLSVAAFQRIIQGFYSQEKRSFEWRETTDPYAVLVSELMLQQTQTSRVAERFPLFLSQFPTVRCLAQSPQSQVIKAWEGLGYYRRARNLHRAAIEVCERHGGVIPVDISELKALPGLGDYTASAVSVFAFNRPAPMVETNIRAVYLYAFFSGRADVPDAEIRSRVEETMPRSRCRDWFYALMDFGVELKKARPRINHKSKHHAVQSRFEGSDRQIAARILKSVVSGRRGLTIEDVCKTAAAERSRVDKAIERLIKDGLVRRTSAGRLLPC